MTAGEPTPPDLRREDIFRREALEHGRVARAAPADLIQLSPLWPVWGFWAVLAGLLAGLLCLLVVRVEEPVVAAAVFVDEEAGLVRALFPPASAEHLETGGTLVVSAGGVPEPAVATIVEVGDLVSPEEAREPPFELASATAPTVGLTARLSSEEAARLSRAASPAAAVAHVRQSLIQVLNPGLDYLLRGGDG